MPPDATGRWCGWSSRVLLQAVAAGADGHDRDGAPAGGQLAPQVADVDVDDVGRRIVTVAPHRPEDLLTVEDLSGMVHEVGEEVELRVGEPDDLAAAADLAREQVDLQLPVAHDRRRSLAR